MQEIPIRKYLLLNIAQQGHLRSSPKINRHLHGFATLNFPDFQSALVVLPVERVISATLSPVGLVHGLANLVPHSWS
jgi:hypothetical protein